MQNELKIKVTSNTSNAISEFNKLQKALEGTNQELTSMSKNSKSTTLKTVTKEGNELLKVTQRLNQNGLSSFSVSLSKANKEGKSLGETLKSVASTAAKIGAVSLAAKSLFNSMSKFTSYSVDYSEALNLFNTVFDNIQKNGVTTFSEVGKKADEFQKKLSENFGANETESATYQALFQSMGVSQGFSDEVASIMSENSTKLVYDLSSLFNTEQEDAAEALRSGIYAGQVKPLRTYGVDLTEKSLQVTLEEMQKTNSQLDGLTVTTMSQAEKQLLRYLTVLKQTTNAQGDFANTIESPANLLRTLTNQISNAAVALGNLFVKPFQKLLQYANAIVIVIKRVAQTIAGFFGIKIEDYNTGISASVGGLEDVGDAYDGIGNSADKAGKKANKLKRQLLSFDEVHNINEDTGTSGSGGASGGGGGGATLDGINQALLDSLKGYENGLDSVRLKAQEIADTIMSWLGFEYDAETGLWKLGPAYDNVKAAASRLSDALKDLSKYTFENLENFYNHLLKPLAKWTLGKGLPKFLDIITKLIKETNWNKLNNSMDNFYKSLEPFTEKIGEGLLWFLDNVVRPISSFTISNIIPEFFNALAHILDILSKSIDNIKPLAKFLFDNFLKPLAEWTGGAVVTFLKDLNWILETISNSKVLTTLTGLAGAFTLLKASTVGIIGSFKGLDTKILSNAKAAEEAGTKVGLLSSAYLTLRTALSKVVKPFGDLASSIANASTEKGKFLGGTEGEILKNMGKNSDTLKDKINKLGESFKNAGQNIKGVFNQLTNGIQTWSNTATAIDKLTVAMVGAGIAQTSGSQLYENYASGKDTAANTTMGMAGSIAGGAMMGTSIGGLTGTVIGGLAGGAYGLYEIISGSSEETKKLKEAEEELEYQQRLLEKAISDSKLGLKEYKEEMNKSIEKAQESATTDQAKYDRAEMYIGKLGELVTANGDVIGSEDEVKKAINFLNEMFGTNYKVVDGSIVQDGKKVDSMKKVIDKYTEENKALRNTALVKAYYDTYEKSLTYVSEHQKDFNSLKDELLKKMEKVDMNDEASKRKFLINNQEKIRQYTLLQQNMLNAHKNIDEYESASLAASEGKYDEVSKHIEKMNEDVSYDMMSNLDILTGDMEKMKKNLENDASDLSKTYSTTLDELNKKEIKVKTDSSGVSKTLEGIGTVIGKFNKKIKIDADLNPIKNTLSGAKITLSSVADKAKGVITSMFKFSAYASGGFPEEGPFFMNRGELAGKFSNGKSVVANNYQITEGIRRAVVDGMSQVMSSGGQNIKLDIRAEEGIIVKKAINGINEMTRTTGESPLIW